MKHKVKLIGVRGDIITLMVDGVECSYFIRRPTPLSPTDAVRLVMDTNILESLAREATGLMRSRSSPWARFAELFSGVCWHVDKFPGLSCDIAGYIEKVGVEVNIDKKTKGIIMLKSDVDKIREGKV